MRVGVLPLNVIIAVFYIILAAVVIFVLKKSSRPLKIVNKVERGEKQGWKDTLNYNKLIAISWVKKYTFIGSLLNEDKKYLLKQFLFLAAYSVTSLQINSIILWPAAFTIFLLPILFLVNDVLLKKLQLISWKATQQNSVAKRPRINAIQNQGSSQMQIEVVNIDAIPAITTDPIEGIKAKQCAKQTDKSKRTNYQLITNSSVGFVSIIMLYQTVMILTNSVSNSGQLNITSVLIICAIDQFTIRPVSGLLVFSIIKILQRIYGGSILESSFVSFFCQEQVQSIIAEYLKEKKRRQLEMTASPPRKKRDSPSRVPKASQPNSDQPTYLNLINLQPTRRKTEQQQEEEISAGIENIYLTTLQQQLFGEGQETKNGSITKRRSNKQNKQHSYLSAVQKFTIEEENCDDDSKQNPLQECTINRVEPFNYVFSPINYTKRKPVTIRKKHKRVLNLTGSSPYLEYLPDMLKNVDKFKQMPKETRII